jgi:hypothetical protein
VKPKEKPSLPGVLPGSVRSMSVTSEGEASVDSLPPAPALPSAARPLPVPTEPAAAKPTGGKFLDHTASPPGGDTGSQGPDFAQPPIKKKQGVKRKADTTTADPGSESAEEKKPARQVDNIVSPLALDSFLWRKLVPI